MEWRYINYNIENNTLSSLESYIYKLLISPWIMSSELYHPEVRPFINSTPELDRATEALWKAWRPIGEEIDMKAARQSFLEAVVATPNIGKSQDFVPHSFTVSRQSRAWGEKVLENYPQLAKVMGPDQLEFAGLVEDSMYLVGGNPYSANDWQGPDSNPIHELLTWLQMDYMGMTDLADGMAMHFVAPQILEAEQAEGRFMSVPTPKDSPMLDILTAVDALSMHYWVPMEFGGDLWKALDKRVADVIDRRRGLKNGENHPLVVGYDNGGKDRLERSVANMEDMVKEGGLFSNATLDAMYKL